MRPVLFRCRPLSAFAGTPELQQTHTDRLGHIEHAFKACNPTVVGIWHVLPDVILMQIAIQLQMRHAGRRLQSLQCRQVLPVHCQHILKTRKVFDLDLTGTQRSHVITAP